MIRKLKCDVVHTCLGPISGIYLKAAKDSGVPIRIAHIHSKLDDSDQGSLFQKKYLKRELFYLNKYATKKVSCSLEAGMTFFKNKEEIITRINPLENSSINCANKTKSKYLRIVQIGRMTKVKNFIFSLDVIKKMLDDDIKVVFYVVMRITDDKYYSQFCSKIDELNLGNRVVFLDPNIDKNVLFKHCDILLLPSFSEACPLVALEAQMSNTAVVASSNVPSDIDFGLCTFVREFDPSVWKDEILKVFYSKKS